MKGFLFDENLPKNVTFAPTLPLIHAKSLGVSVSDSALWQHARANQLVIVSKDADFSHRMMLASPPPWVVQSAIFARGISMPCLQASRRSSRVTNWRTFTQTELKR